MSVPQAPTLAQTTPFPNVLLDQVMPTLRDTEWRLLCVIVRQTLGWQDKRHHGARKAADWLTHNQLQRRTGRASEAICGAIDALVQRGFIEVRNATGQALWTSRARRRCGDQLFYSLGPSLLKRLEPNSNTKAYLTFSESEIRKPKTTKATYTKY